MKQYIFFFLALAAALSGCSRPEEEADSDLPQKVALTGSVEERFVGAWKSQDGKSRYELKKDGSYLLTSTRTGQQGKLEMKVEGRWRSTGSSLLFEDAAKNVVPYDLAWEGGKLSLKRPGSKSVQIVLVKAKP